jgi:hypothetical protein
MGTRIKKTYVCRNISDYQIISAIPTNYFLEAGDVGVFEVVEIGKHSRIQAANKLSMTIIRGDRIMAAFGTRYATAQIEGYMPDHLDQELHILGAGGTVGVVRSMHSNYERVGPTTLRLVGLVTDKEGRVLNTKKMERMRMTGFTDLNTSFARIILSLGSSMDSGKTTSAAYLAHGLKQAGHRVAYIKLTGTIYTKDADLAYDLGADITTDFGEFGFPSTYMCNERELLDLYASLLDTVMPSQPDYIIIEIADGLYERETKMLLKHAGFISTIDESMGNLSGLHLRVIYHQPLIDSGSKGKYTGTGVYDSGSGLWKYGHRDIPAQV